MDHPISIYLLSFSPAIILNDTYKAINNLISHFFGGDLKLFENKKNDIRDYQICNIFFQCPTVGSIMPFKALTDFKQKVNNFLFVGYATITPLFNISPTRQKMCFILSPKG